MGRGGVIWLEPRRPSSRTYAGRTRSTLPNSLPRSPPTFLSNSQPSSSWWSTSRQPRRSAWPSRRRCCCGPIKWSS